MASINTNLKNVRLLQYVSRVNYYLFIYWQHGLDDGQSNGTDCIREYGEWQNEGILILLVG